MSAFILHLLALGFMIIDHLRFIPGLAANYGILFICIGRLAFPLFALKATEGWHHTKNHGQYLLRMVILAVISEVPFDLMVFGKIDTAGQNVIWTILISLLVIGGIESTWKQEGSKSEQEFVSCAIFVAGMAMAGIMNTDYSYSGVILIVGMYFLKQWSYRILLMVFVNLVLFGNIKFEPSGIPVQSLALLSLPLMWIYNGKLGYQNKFIKYILLMSYPIHMMVIWLIRIL